MAQTSTASSVKHPSTTGVIIAVAMLSIGAVFVVRQAVKSALQKTTAVVNTVESGSIQLCVPKGTEN
jgi:hypothetical protein